MKQDIWNGMKCVHVNVENVEEVKLAKITSAEEGKNKHKFSSCTQYIVYARIGSYFINFH